MIPDRIVVGVDGSEPSKDALRWARFMADATGRRHAAASGTGTFGPARHGDLAGLSDDRLTEVEK
jgi:nucleotide-binding universal stress UspA family protein